MTSVVIPAHNEERVIVRCLERLLADAEAGEFEVIVVANGCSDRTAAVAVGIHPDVRVLDTPIASKSNALNFGDQAASRFPRVYVDADINLDTDALRAMASVLQGGALAAAPRLCVDLRGASRYVKAYYRIWRRTGYVERGLIGSGVYGLSESGRARFEVFPDIIADDLFVYSLFSSVERVTVDAEFVITPPRRLGDLVNVKTRVFAGNLQHRAAFPDSQMPPRQQVWSVLRSLPPREWAAAAVYVGVQAAAKVRGHRKVAAADLSGWERDDTGRATIGSD